MNNLRLQCITPSSGNDQLLYFTSTSIVEDGGLVFISDRTGHPNLFYRNGELGNERQLTENKEGYLKSYVYFDGNPYRGFGKASISLDAERGRAYYIQGREVRCVDIDGDERSLAELPANQMTAFTHVSRDGSRLCIPTTDSRALDDEAPLQPSRPEYDVDERIRAENLSSYLNIFDTLSGQMVDRIEVPRAWVTHVQFSPLSNEQILYNHEWPSTECGMRRLWLWDGTQHAHIPLRTEGEGRSRHDWVCHEMWERDGRHIIYHGIYHGGAAFIGRMRSDGSDIREIALPSHWHRYGHFTVGRSGELVSDGYYQSADAENGPNGEWICLLGVDWEAGLIDWRPLVRHRSSWRSQDAHPHPILDSASKAVYFTSDYEGSRSVYRLPLGAEPLDAPS